MATNLDHDDAQLQLDNYVPHTMIRPSPQRSGRKANRDRARPALVAVPLATAPSGQPRCLTDQSDQQIMPHNYLAPVAADARFGAYEKDRPVQSLPQADTE
jgi:hypothetical protein